MKRPTWQVVRLAAAVLLVAMALVVGTIWFLQPFERARDSSLGARPAAGAHADRGRGE